MHKKNSSSNLKSGDYTRKLCNENTSFAVSEGFNTVRGNISYLPIEDKCPVYGITSAMAGAGKSIITANVAASFANAGKKVLVIDCDLRCPVQNKIFSIEGETVGLSECLAGLTDKPLDKLVKKTSVAGLDLLTSGRSVPNVAAILSSGRFDTLIEQARSNYDCIFFDLPPLAVVPDAGIVSRLVSGYIMVARSGYSNLRSTRNALESFDIINARVLGFVLNDVPLKDKGYYKKGYGYGYGHGYGYGRKRS